jgi:hypothetical protein
MPNRFHQGGRGGHKKKTHGGGVRKGRKGGGGKGFQAAVSRKIEINTREMHAGTLYSGPGKHHRVTDPDQMKAISYSEARKARGGGGGSRTHRRKFHY